MFKKRLKKDPKYFTISFYTVITVIICAIFIKILFNWDSFTSGVSMIFSILAPFFIGIFFAYVLYPLVKVFRDGLFIKVLKFKSKKAALVLGVAITYILVVGFIVLVIAFVIPQLIESVLDLIKQAESSYTELPTFFDNLSKQFPKVDFSIAQDWLTTNLPDIISKVQVYLTDELPSILSASVTVIKWIANIVIAVIVSVYFCLDKDHLMNGFRRLVYAILKKERAVKFMKVGKECNTIFGNYLYGNIVDSIIVSIVCAIAMTILGLPYPILISVVIGLTNLIPYFGPFIGAIPSAIIILMDGWQPCLIFVILIICIQVVDGYVVAPKIIGDGVGLRPLWIIFAIVIGGFVAGPIGMFLGVPIVAVIAYLINLKTNSVLKSNDMDDLVSDEQPEHMDKFNAFEYFNPMKNKNKSQQEKEDENETKKH